jgi:signal transduction histidine kinase
MNTTNPAMPYPPVKTGELTDDLELFRALKPYIGHCLRMNHDINNSLAGIIGYCEFLLLDSAALPPQHRRQVEIIAKCAEKIQQLVQNLCEEKIALAEKIDLRPVVEAYTAVEKKLD